MQILSNVICCHICTINNFVEILYIVSLFVSCKNICSINTQKLLKNNDINHLTKIPKFSFSKQKAFPRLQLGKSLSICAKKIFTRKGELRVFEMDTPYKFTKSGKFCPKNMICFLEFMRNSSHAIVQMLFKYFQLFCYS